MGIAAEPTSRLLRDGGQDRRREEGAVAHGTNKDIGAVTNNRIAGTLGSLRSFFFFQPVIFLLRLSIARPRARTADTARPDVTYVGGIEANHALMQFNFARRRGHLSSAVYLLRQSHVYADNAR